MGIGAELSGIKREMKRYNDHVLDRGESEPEDTFECRCGAEFPSAKQAKDHAIREHKAPDSAWQELYQ